MRMHPGRRRKPNQRVEHLEIASIGESSTIDGHKQWFSGSEERRVSVSDRDIYAITAPIQRAIFATERILWLARIVFSTGTHHARPSKEKHDAYRLH